MFWRRHRPADTLPPVDLSPRERVWRALKRQPLDRVPCVDCYFLPETLQQWQREGYPADVTPADFFDLDLICLPVDCTMGWREEVLDETDEYRIVVEADGVTRKHWKVYHAQPQELDFPVKQMRDWRQIRPALKAHEGRLPANLPERVAHARERHRFVALSFVEPCTLARRLLGSRQWVEAFQTQPPLLDEILETGVRLIVETVDLALKALSSSPFVSPPVPRPPSLLDGVWLHADLAYTHGAFLTEREYRHIVLPYHRQLTNELHRRGLAVLLYTQGKVDIFVKTAQRSGMDAVLPLETFSQNDLATYKRAFGQTVTLGGGISADRLMESEEAAEEEVRTKVSIGMGASATGYLFCLDRPVPPFLPLHRYRRILELARTLTKVTGGG
ncbi:MAG: hypothetical protein PVTTEEND_001288 [Candidatus Fervidibacter sp.]|jgi:Uroporphyrinogen-III decarboxylase